MTPPAEAKGETDPDENRRAASRERAGWRVVGALIAGYIGVYLRPGAASTAPSR